MNYNPEDSLTYNLLPGFEPLWQPGYSSLADSTGTVTPQLVIEPISQMPLFGNFVFLILLFCFTLTSYTIGKKNKMLMSMLNELIYVKGRQSIFYADVGTETYVKILLHIQTLILFSIIAYCYLLNNYEMTEESFFKDLSLITFLFSLFAMALLCKYVFYNITGSVFFERETLQQWISNFTSLVSLLGIVVFIPAIFMFYVEKAYLFCAFFVFFCLLTAGIVIVYKTYMLFFYNRNRLLHLFLYLCGQEILPLFLLYKGFIYMFNVVEKSALWL